MNPAPEPTAPEPAGPRAWSGSRVVWVTVAFTVLQTSIVLRWGKAPTFSHGPAEVAGGSAWVWDAPSAAAILQGSFGAQPDAFGDDPRNPFQAIARNSLPRPTYQFAQWSAPPLWLSNPPLAAVVAPFPAPLVPRSDAVAQPSLPGGVASPLIATQTLAAVAGSLSSRAWERPPQLGSWSGPDLLGSTRIDVWVNQQGWVVAAQVGESSGLRAADETARQALLDARFLAVPGASRRVDFAPGSLTAGAVIVQWHTQPPASVR